MAWPTVGEGDLVLVCRDHRLWCNGDLVSFEEFSGREEDRRGSYFLEEFSGHCFLGEQFLCGIFYVNREGERCWGIFCGGDDAKKRMTKGSGRRVSEEFLCFDMGE